MIQCLINHVESVHSGMISFKIHLFNKNKKGKVRDECGCLALIGGLRIGVDVGEMNVIIISPLRALSPNFSLSKEM